MNAGALRVHLKQRIERGRATSTVTGVGDSPSVPLGGAIHMSVIQWKRPSTAKDLIDRVVISATPPSLFFHIPYIFPPFKSGSVPGPACLRLTRISQTP